MLFKQLHFLRIVRADAADRHAYESTSTNMATFAWSSDEDMCERMQIVKSTSKIMKMKDLKTKTTREPKEKETHTHTHTQKKKAVTFTYADDDRACCRHTPPDKHDHFSSATTFMPRLLAACIRPGERERERVLRWQKKSNQANGFKLFNHAST